MRTQIFAAAMALMLLVASPAMAETIKIGVLSDLSGPTSSVGVPYAKGVQDCVRYLNESKFLGEHTLQPLQVDYAYNVQQALSAYKKFKTEGIVALQGWGTADTEALTRFVAQDKIPCFSASYSAHLTDPKNAPYNFFVVADYTSNLRGILKFFKDNWKEERAPKLAFIYPDHPYGLTPLEGGKAYAKELGYEVVGDEHVDLKAMDATSQLLALKSKAPDFCWIGGTTPSTSVVLKDAQKLKMDTIFFTNIWGIDEDLFKLAGDAAEGAYTVQGASTGYDDTAGNKIILELTGGQIPMTHYYRGFASTYVMAEAIRRALEKGTLTGEAVKNETEALRDFDPLGLTPPVSFFPDDHRPTMTSFIYKVEGGKLVKVGTEVLERKAEWLGK
ncbi:ABC transporter substrate-binding protein [Megalodesulfovibrio gigas]|uniref:Putative ABC transporter substrate binding protein n=1 Tax=Megalodesulfovibrio gigas (strain ATCC 19364 / DSM 1382 / NCIMB 9332 / VKM B-1759) TaxID=1121448 RepID=T2GBN2_MEGG1|nr:ABC transporter substrate-binding protein [Megalodesulfovibrio gigas]AGW14000.1 putative ABC transporter substrate binding protein precursor [Megalodesulfovibrio gigas DSM 1382 = ATCC 19364]